MVFAIKKFLAAYLDLYPLTRSMRENYSFTRAIVNGKMAVYKLSERIHLLVRPNVIDLDVLKSTFLEKYHRCPFQLPAAAVIVDIGSNVGYTLADFRMQYPDARLIGVELDKENFLQLQENVRELGNCSVLNAGVWKTDGVINYSGKDAQSFNINTQSKEGATAEAITMDSLFSRYNIETADYVKMDIEGAEEEIFFGSDFQKWLAKVRYMSIEVHDTEKHSNAELRQKIKTAIEAAGFFVMQSSVHWSSLVAVNKQML